MNTVEKGSFPEMKKIFAALLALSMMLTMTALCAEAVDSESPEENIPVQILYDYVVQADTITELDYEYAKQELNNSTDGWGGKCSAAARVLPNGDMVVGRNMDYYISNYPCIIVHTRTPGYHETYGISYNNSTGPTFEDVKANGLSQAYAKLMPFLVNDAMNEAGLYVEMNMRVNEHFDDPADDYGCPGTNPGASERVCEIMLPQQIALNCANIDEMLEYVHSIDIYTMSKGDSPWNLAFIVADASGRYGLLEIARNQISWLEGQPIQTNYYISESFAANETKIMGTGRYAVLEKGLPEVQTEEDMQALMDQVSYFQIYFPATCKFDFRTELVDDYPEWNYDFVTDPANWGFMMEYMSEDVEMLSSATRQELQDMNSLWETVFNNLVNCTKKTMRLRFFEGTEKVVTLSFDAA